MEDLNDECLNNYCKGLIDEILIKFETDKISYSSRVNCLVLLSQNLIINTLTWKGVNLCGKTRSQALYEIYELMDGAIKEFEEKNNG